MSYAQLVALCPACGETTEFVLSKKQILIMLLELAKGGAGVYVNQECEHCKEKLKVAVSGAMLKALLQVFTENKVDSMRARARFESLCD
jgi:hypothetical protein